MKKIVFIILLFTAFQSFGQNRFPSIDSLKNYTLRYYRNSTVETFTNLRGQNIAYGTLELLDSLAGAGVIDSIWKTSGGGVDTLKYRVSGLTVVVGTFSGGGSSYTFANGLTETAGTVKAGGFFDADSISFKSHTFKPFRSRITFTGTSFETDWLQTGTGFNANVFGSPATSFSNFNLTSSAFGMKSQNTSGAGEVIGGTSAVSLKTTATGDPGKRIDVTSTYITFNNGDNTDVKMFHRADSTEWFHRLVYGANYRSLFTPFTLVDKGYVDSLVAASGGTTALNNVGTGFDLAQELTDNVKRLQAGFGIKLDSITTANSVRVSLDTTTQTLTDGATITFDANSGTSAQVTLGGNRTLAFSNFSAGVYLTLVVIQDGTGSRTLTLPAGTKVINGGAGAVTLTTAAASEDILTFFKIGTTIYCNYGKNYN